ncbi:MAG TPA: FAD-dependent oxidoreductase, partial [Polyangiaceae bacterium]
IPKPPLEDVLKSAIGIPTEGYLHQLYFHYPKQGGYEALVHAYAARVTGGELCTSCPVTRIEGGPGAWLVEAGGQVQRFETLVSTLPIHDLAGVWAGFPAEGRAALARLRSNSLINVLVGLNEDRGYPYTALYVPDPQIPFHRLSFPKNFSPECAPAGASAMMLELTCEYDDEVWSRTDDDLIGDSIAKLVEMGLVSPESVSYTRVMRFRYGYPIYDHAYFEQTRKLRESIARSGLELLGRFAEFEYINSDQCVERALSLAQKLNDTQKPRGDA